MAEKPEVSEDLEIQKARGDFVDGEEVQEPEAEAEAEEEVVEEEIVEEDDDQPGDAPVAEEEPITIPKARFDEAQRKARERQEELERRVKEMESQQYKKTTETDASKLQEEIDELETQYEDLLMEGEVEKARAVRRDMRRKENDLFDMRLTQKSTQASQVAVEQMRFDAQLAQFEAKYPAINPDSDAFNPDLAGEVAQVMAAFQANGMTAASALNKAVHYVIRDDEPRATEDPDIVRSRRGQQARKKVAAAVKKSPPDLSDKGRDSDKVGSGDGLPDVTRMSPEEFDKLTDAQRRKLRGDHLSDEEAA